MKTNKLQTKSALGLVILFYFLVAFEFFYMATPFAVFFYSAYKPALAFLDHFPSISWMMGFFLPHLVDETSSFALNQLKISGAVTAGIGLLIFIVCAVQVYYSKLFKKGAVLKGLYRYIRHPQYLAFAICSFGLLMLWPRYLVLIMFITMLFVYYFLARYEEKECVEKYGETYIRYQSATGMFFPNRNRKKFSLFFNLPGKLRFAAIIVFYLFILISSLFFVSFLKKASVDQLYTWINNDACYVSIMKTEPGSIQHFAMKAEQTGEIFQFINHFNIHNRKIICYLLPSELYISEIPMQKPVSEQCHVIGKHERSDIIKMIYSIAVFRNGANDYSGKQILIHALQLQPVAEVWMDIRSDRIIKTQKLINTNRYKNIAEPIF
jgi:protein-S-isoprenylcysteine O-methyltransferase Ste14